MKTLLIAGAGGCGRETLDWVRDLNRATPTWRIKGFLADNPETALAGHDVGLDVVATTRDYRPENDEEYVICAIGSPVGKKTVTERLRERGARFATVIHPQAVVSPSARIGTGVIIYPNAVIAADAVLGDFVTLLVATVGPGAEVGAYSTVSSFAHIDAEARIDAECEISSHACVLGGAHLGHNGFVAAAAVVRGDFPPGTRLFGNPARPMTMTADTQPD